MSSYGVGVSPVSDSGLLTSASFSAASTPRGSAKRIARSPAAAAIPAAAAAAINARRFTYVSRGVISDDCISVPVRINITPYFTFLLFDAPAPQLAAGDPQRATSYTLLLL